MIRDLEKLFLEKINLEDEWWNSDYDSVSFIDSTSHDMTECIHCCRVIVLILRADSTFSLIYIVCESYH